MEKEFWSVAETEGITDIEELNKILDRAVNLKNFLKGDERVDKIAKYVAEHYVKNVEPLGYKAFLVGVDRPACAKYKKALDKYLPAGILGRRLHRQQQRHAGTEGAPHRREEGEAGPQGLRQGRASCRRS